MGAETFEFAVIGSSPLALLLAGLLANRHGRSVCLVAESHAAYRLPRGFDLSVAPVARPETWSLLRATVPETLKLIGKVVGKAAYERVDPVFVGETPWGRDALGHVRHVALGFGQAVEPLPETPFLPAGAAASRFRDAYFLHRPLLEGGLAPWLKASGVRLLPPDAAAAEFKVLADDAAALAHGSRLLHPSPVTSLLTEPVAPLPSPLMAFLDRNTTLRQGAGRGVAALVHGSGDGATGQLGAILGGKARSAGEAGLVTATTADGGPMVGLSEPGVFSIAALGLSGAFLAPAIARFLAGAASAREADWIEARSPLADRSLVSEIAP